MRKIQDTTTRVVRFELEVVEQEDQLGSDGRRFRPDHLLLEYATLGGVGELRLARAAIDGAEVNSDGTLDNRRYRTFWSWKARDPWPPPDAPRVAVEAAQAVEAADIEAQRLAAVRRTKPSPDARAIAAGPSLDTFGGPSSDDLSCADPDCECGK